MCHYCHTVVLAGMTDTTDVLVVEQHTQNSVDFLQQQHIYYITTNNKALGEIQHSSKTDGPSNVILRARVCVIVS